MAVFSYQALNSSGQEVKDEVEAPTKEEAVAKVRSLGYFPTKVIEKAGKKRLAARKASGGIKKRKAAGTGFGLGFDQGFDSVLRVSYQHCRMPACRSCGVSKFSSNSRNPGC